MLLLLLLLLLLLYVKCQDRRALHEARAAHSTISPSHRAPLLLLLSAAVHLLLLLLLLLCLYISCQLPLVQHEARAAQFINPMVCLCPTAAAILPGVRTLLYRMKDKLRTAKPHYFELKPSLTDTAQLHKWMTQPEPLALLHRSY